jgi:hypothetical protein
MDRLIRNGAFGIIAVGVDEGDVAQEHEEVFRRKRL